MRRFGLGELLARDKANLDITWLRDESLVEDLAAAPAEFEAVAVALEIQEADRPSA